MQQKFIFSSKHKDNSWNFQIKKYELKRQNGFEKKCFYGRIKT